LAAARALPAFEEAVAARQTLAKKLAKGEGRKAAGGDEPGLFEEEEEE
jgi:hypothetical protein